ncbi:hypothetical protein OG478_13645 [Streptomyces phaeochromogenes]|uniref:hypothetical protein n=1 Tax=Streptomyces phaeochromogenes TaxID=1923 RepID=UPI00386B6C87|nr:hypothetical protein OG478_13645 [Streptomyces phaeochromogenes]
MTPDAMAERPIEDLAPEWIGLKMEVEDEHGVTVGFRLGRYEKSTTDGRPVWRLFSDQPSWSVTVYGGTKLRWVPQPPALGSQTVPYQHQSVPAAHPGPQVPQYPAAPPPGPVARSAQSWVTPPHQ